MINSEMRVSRPAWTGGIWEAGAGSGFSSLYGDVQPYIAYTDNVRSRVQAVEKVLGIKEDLKTDANSWRLRLTGVIVPVLTREFAEFAPSRRTIFLAFQMWYELDYEQSIELVKELKGKNRVLSSVDNYIELVRNDEFLTGVIDARAIAYQPKSGKKYLPTVILTTQNKSLAFGLQECFGGRVRPTKYSERNMSLDDVKSVTWVVSREGLVEEIEGHLVDSVRFPHGFNSDRIAA